MALDSLAVLNTHCHIDTHTTAMVAIKQINLCQPSSLVKNWRISLEQFYCLHVLADRNCCILIREKIQLKEGRSIWSLVCYCMHVYFTTLLCYTTALCPYWIKGVTYLLTYFPTFSSVVFSPTPYLYRLSHVLSYYLLTFFSGVSQHWTGFQ